MYCKWADDNCVGSKCNYALCIRGRLLSNGVCGLSIKRKTNEEMGPEVIKIENIKLREKLKKRFREEDLI